MSYTVKTYVVQKADRDGRVGEVIAVKLTYQEAHSLARFYAPAKVVSVIADKTPDANGPAFIQDHPPCSQLQLRLV